MHLKQLFKNRTFEQLQKHFFVFWRLRILEWSLSSLLKNQKEKSAFGTARKFDFWKVVSSAWKGSKCVPTHFPSVAHCFGTNFWPTEWIWSDFTENKNYFDFFKTFCLVIKHVLYINPSKNEHDFGFLNCFSKTKHLIKIWNGEVVRLWMKFLSQ